MNKNTINNIYDRVINNVGGLNEISKSIIDRINLYIGFYKNNTQQFKDDHDEQFIATQTTYNLFKKQNISLPVHLLIQSRTGLGKSLLINSILSEIKLEYHDLDYQILNSTNLYQENEGDTERYLTTLIKRNNRISNTPFILVLEEFDAISVKRDHGKGGKIERGVTTHLIDLLDSNSKSSNIDNCIFIIGITNRFNSIDSELFQCGRLDSVINIPIPLPADRKHILTIMIKKYANYKENEQHYNQLIEYLSNCTHGFVGADLQHLCNEAATFAIIKQPKSIQHSKDSRNILICKEHFDEMFHTVKPSILNQYNNMHFDNISFDSIGGLDSIIKRIQTAVLLPILNSEPLTRMGVSPPSGLLMYGPPGNGKSLIARAIATSSPNINFIAVQSTDIISPIVGESEKKLTALFKVVRESAPCILFLDQIEVLARQRGFDSSTEQSADRLLSCLLIEMDGFSGSQQRSGGGSIVLGATTRIDMLDPTILRPGRFDYHIEIPNPNHAGRLDILEKLTKSMPLADDVDLQTITTETDGCCGADLANLCKESALIALRHNLNSKNIEMKHFRESMNNLKFTKLK